MASNKMEPIRIHGSFTRDVLTLYPGQFVQIAAGSDLVEISISEDGETRVYTDVAVRKWCEHPGAEEANDG